MVDRLLLRYFLAVVDAGSFSRAAVKVNVTQPTLSVGIAKLEALLETPLFLRSNRRVHLTDAGTQLLGHARRIEEEFNLLANTVASAHPGPLIRVGVLSTIPTAVVRWLVEEYRRREERVQLELFEGAERDLALQLGRGRVDLAVTVLRANSDTTHEPLFEEEYRLVLPRSHRLAGKDEIRAEELAGEAMIVRRHCEALQETSRHFVNCGVRPRFGLRTTNDDKALALTAAGLGITVMPASFRHPDVVRPRLASFELERRIGIQLGASATASTPGLASVGDLLRRMPAAAPLGLAEPSGTPGTPPCAASKRAVRPTASAPPRAALPTFERRRGDTSTLDEPPLVG